VAKELFTTIGQPYKPSAPIPVEVVVLEEPSATTNTSKAPIPTTAAPNDQRPQMRPTLPSAISTTTLQHPSSVSTATLPHPTSSVAATALPTLPTIVSSTYLPTFPTSPPQLFSPVTTATLPQTSSSFASTASATTQTPPTTYLFTVPTDIAPYMEPIARFIEGNRNLIALILCATIVFWAACVCGKTCICGKNVCGHEPTRSSRRQYRLIMM